MMTLPKSFKIKFQKHFFNILVALFMKQNKFCFNNIVFFYHITALHFTMYFLTFQTFTCAMYKFG